ncbi:MAG: hypothetical protein Q9208_006620 [Pyrenodesmia sp. 3 TL-2023]
MPSTPHRLPLLLLLPLLPLFFLPTTSQQTTATITLTLTTTNDETFITLSLPFSTLFSPPPPRNKGVEIHVTSSLPIAQDAIRCQCFADAAGTQRLGESFGTEFPGARLAAEEPVEIGAIFCSDEEGLRRQMDDSGAAEKDAVVVPEATSKEASASSTQTSTTTTSSARATIATTATPDAETPTAFIRFNLSPDPSDDSSTQMRVPIDSSVVIITDDKRAASVEVTTIDGLPQSADSGLVCQVFADAGAEEPLAGGFGFEEVMELGLEGEVGEEGEGVRSVGAVGCAVLGGRDVGGKVGLVRSS